MKTYFSEIDSAINNLLNKLSRQDLNSIFSSFISALSDIMNESDGYTGQHTLRVSQLSFKIAERMNYSADMINDIVFASKVHDIGKVRVSASILARPGKLMDSEVDLIKKHTVIGFNILSKIKNIGKIPLIVYQHHERIDYSGYPNKLGAEDILKEAKVLMVSDVCESIIHHRPYRNALGVEAAIQELEVYKGIKYDLDISNTTIKILEEGFVFA